MLRPMPASASDSRLPSKTTPSKARLSEEETVPESPEASRPADFMLPPTPSSSR